jgi:hypothetical protein
MKTTRALVISLALVSTMAVQAQDLASASVFNRSDIREGFHKALNFPVVEANYLNSLNSEIPGVVESALGHITLMRIAYPRQDLKRLQEKLYELASLGATRSIRQKAFIAMQVFGNPAAFKESIAGRQYNGDGLIEEIAAQR